MGPEGLGFGSTEFGFDIEDQERVEEAAGQVSDQRKSRDGSGMMLIDMVGVSYLPMSSVLTALRRLGYLPTYEPQNHNDYA